MTSARGERGTWRFLGFWEGGDLDLAATRANLPCDDLHAAELAASKIWPAQLHYVPGDKMWNLWDGRCLRPDDSLEIARRMDTIAHWYEQLLAAARQAIEATLPPGSDRERAAALSAAMEAWKAHTAYAAGLRKPAAKGLTERLAARCGTTPEALQAGAWHARTLNAWDRVVNLLPEPGEPEWYAHDPRWQMTYCVEANYEPGSASPEADCPEYRELLWMACGGVPEVYWWLIKALGYSLLGGNPLQLIFFLSGPTASGKSTLLEILSTVLGPQLAYEAKPELITRAGMHPRHARHEASMRGARLITMSETNNRLMVDEMQLKRLTGEKRVAIEMLYAKTMARVIVTWAMFIANNEMPGLQHLDGAIRRRMWVAPMGPTIREELRDTAKAARILEHERDGILSLMVWGCREAMKDGGLALLQPPQAIVDMTAGYAAEQDTVAAWLADCTVPNGAAPLVHGADCLASYRRWCEPSRRIGRNQFYDRLGEIATRSGDREHAWFGGFELRETGPDRLPGGGK